MNEHRDAGETTAHPAGRVHSSDGADRSAHPASPPGYELLDEIGRGGMGVVYRARDTALDRDIAIKLLSDRYPPDSPAARRFAEESRITGQLQHPGIPAVHQVGTLAGGRPYLAMKLIKGSTLETILMQRPDAAADRGGLLAAFEAVCQAVGYAHAHRVIHRDLKPANVMVGAFGEVQVMDWGLAKVLGQETSGAADTEAAEQTRVWTEVSPTPEGGSHTMAGSLVGTPAFIPPEQALGEVDKVNERSDVFGLGAILAVILTGEPPYVGESFESVRVQAVRGKLDDCFARLDGSGAEPELVALCKTCLAFEPADRPADAGAVAQAVAGLRAAADERARRAELERVRVEGEKATAAAQSAERRKRRRLVIGAAAVLAVAALGGLTAVLEVQRRANSDLAGKNVELADEQAAAEAARDDAQRKEKAERWERYRANLVAAASALQMNNVAAARRSLDDAPAEHRGWEWRHFDSQTDDARFVLRGHTNPVTVVAFSPDGRRVASSGRDHTVRICDTATGAEQWAFKNEGGVAAIAFSANGTRVGSGSNRGAAVWDLATGEKTIVRPNQEEGVTVFPFSAAGVCLPEGRALTHTLRFVDMATGKDVARSVHEVPTNDIAVSQDGRRIATVANDHRMHLWDAQSGARLATLDLGGLGFLVPSLCLSTDGKRVVTGSHYPDNKVRLWDWARAEPVAVMPGHRNTVQSVALSPDGTRIASGSMDQTVRLWDGATGNLIATLRGHSGWVYQVAFSPDGRRLLSASQDRSLRLWDAVTGDLLAVVRGHGNDVLRGAFSPDGRLLASGSQDGTVRLWDVDQLTRRGALRGHSSFVYDVAFSPDGTRVGSAAWDGTVRLWDATTGLQTELLPHEHARATSLAFGSSGDRLAVVADDDAVHWWDLTGGTRVRKLTVPSNSPFGPRVALSPKGDLVAAGGTDGRVRIWAAATGEPVAVLSGHDLSGHDREVRDVAFDPAGGRIASASNDRTVRVWDVMKKETLHVLRGHSNYVYTVAYSGDGKWIASGSIDGTVRLWDAGTFEEVAVLHHGGNVYKVAFSPDGSRLATACADTTIRLWDLATRQEVAELRGHEAYVHSVAWSPDGTRLVSGSGDFTVRIWDTLSVQERGRRTKAGSK